MSITIILVAVTCLVSYFSFQDRGLFDKLKHYPVVEAQNKEYYRFLSSGFVHGSMIHLLFNMYVLYTFGEQVEYKFDELFGSMGKILFIAMYLLTIIFADIPSFLKHRNNPSFASIGASGAVSGIVFIYILFSPWAGLTIFPLFFLSIPAFILGIAYLVYSSWASKNRQDGIDHSAHFYGALFGILFIAVMNPSSLLHFADKLMAGMPF